MEEKLWKFIENYGGVAVLILGTTFDDDGHKWVKCMGDIVDPTLDKELFYWCAWCGVHRVEVSDWADNPQCQAVVAAKELQKLRPVTVE